MKPTLLCLEIISRDPEAPPFLFVPCHTVVQRNIADLWKKCQEHHIAECCVPWTVALDEEGGHTQDAMLSVAETGVFVILIRGEAITRPLTVTQFQEIANTDADDSVVYHGTLDFQQAAQHAIQEDRMLPDDEETEDSDSVSVGCA